MTCAACTKPLPPTGVVELNGLTFCDNLCRYRFTRQHASSANAVAPARQPAAPSAAEQPSPTTTGFESHGLTHLLMALGLVFLVRTRYLVYVELEVPTHVPFAKGLGANISYFTIWAVGYWFAYTSPKRFPNSILALAATLAGPIIMPLVGYGLLLRMFFVRRSQLTGYYYPAPRTSADTQRSAGPIECPRCKLVCPPSATRCDCGQKL